MNRLCCLIWIFIVFFGCDSVKKSDTSDDYNNSDTVKKWLTFEGQSQKPHIVLISGDEEYRSEEALPQLAKILSIHHGFRCTVLFAQHPDKPGIINPNYVKNIPGLELLKSADLMILFTRFRALPDDQMRHIDDYLKTGKPVIGLRTSTHAFKYEGLDTTSNFLHYGNFYDKDDTWKDGFGRLVLGEKWVAHHGKHAHQSTRGVSPQEAQSHPILNGFDASEVWGPSDVYTVRLPLPGDAKVVLLGKVVDPDGDFDENDPMLGMRPSDTKMPGKEEKKVNGKVVQFDRNDPMMPIAWTKSYQIPEGKEGVVFTTTMGASVDLLAEGTRRLIVNAVYWTLGLEVPKKADVQVVGDFEPSRFKFHKDEFWENRNLSIENLN